jgi:hypothetical protein
VTLGLGGVPTKSDLPRNDLERCKHVILCSGCRDCRLTFRRLRKTGTVGMVEAATCNHAGGNQIGDALWLVGAVRVLSRWSSGDAVLVQKAAESIDAQDPCRASELLPREIGDGDFEADSTVGPRGVVVLDELGENALEVTFATDEQPVEALASCGADKPLGERVPRGARTGVLMTRAPIDLITSSKGPTNFESRSRIKNLTTRPSSSSLAARFRACWVTQVPIGCAVTPAKKTLRRSRSMKNST